MGQKIKGKIVDAVLDKLEEGESIFILRGNDVTAPRIIHKWLDANSQIPPEKAKEALDCMQRMVEWQAEGKSKLAD